VWSPDEKYVAYVALEKKKKATSYLDNNEGDMESSAYDYNQDWGEKFVGVARTVICILDTENGTINLVPGIDTNQASVGQPVWVPGHGQRYSIAYTSWPIQSKRLGMIYCFQRACSIYQIDLTDFLASSDSEELTDMLKHTCLTSELALARSPRFSPSGAMMVCLGRRDDMYTHHGCFGLFKLNMLSGEASTEALIDVVQLPDTPGGFGGIYCLQLPPRCFLYEDQLILDTPHGSVMRAVMCHIGTGAHRPLMELLSPLMREEASGSPLSTSSIAGMLAGKMEAAGVSPKQHDKFKKFKNDVSPEGWNDASDSSVSVISVHSSGQIVYSVASPNTPSILYIYDHNDGSTRSAAPDMSYSVSRKVAFSHPLPLLSSIRACRWKVLRLETSTGIPFEAIIILPPGASEEAKAPLVVVPHGGPHSTTLTTFIPNYSFLSVELGAAVLHVNYRGSAGFGEASILALPGRCGEVDTTDMMAALAEAKTLTMIDSSKIGVVGGSHGGFLAAHMIGQHPDVFSACAMRNPVTNIPSMVSVTDIPDWCFVEALGVGTDFGSGQASGVYRIPTSEELIKMQACSPVAHVHKVKTPTLVCLGMMDRRVPHSQGIEYHHLLKHRGVPTRLLCFEKDVHAIDKPASEAHQWIEIARWLRLYGLAA